MSKTFWDKDGKIKLEEPCIDDMNKCKWLCDEVCCNDKCEYVADYPNHKCESKDDCELFEEESKHYNLYPINADNAFPVIEFAKDLEKGKVSVGISSNGNSKLLTITKIDFDCKIGDEFVRKNEVPMLGLLFYKNESIDVVIKYLQKLRKMKID